MPNLGFPNRLRERPRSLQSWPESGVLPMTPFRFFFTITLAALAASITSNSSAQCAIGLATPTHMCVATSAGRVLAAPQIIVDYWGWPNGCSIQNCPSDTVGEIPIVEQVLKTQASTSGIQGGFLGTRWANVETQYSGFPFGSSNKQYIPNWVYPYPIPSFFSPNVPPNPANSITDPQMVTEANAAISYARGLGYSIGNDAVVFLMLPPNETPLTSGCATDRHYGTNPVVLMNYNGGCDAVPPGVNSTVAYQSLTLEHEYVEELTNPSGDAWSGWTTYGYPTTGGFSETADLCKAGQPGATTPSTIAVALQPSTVANWTQAEIAHLSNKAGAPGIGACVFARATQADLFGIGTAPYHLYHKGITADDYVVNGSWMDWGTLGTQGSLSGAPASVSWAPYRTDVFVTDNQNHVRHGYTDGLNYSCPGPDSPCYDDWGGPAGWNLLANPAVTSWGPGRVDVFVTAWQYQFGGVFAYHVFQRSWDAGTDSGWVDRQQAASPPAMGPAATTYSPGGVDLFVVGQDGNIYHGVYTKAGNTFTWAFWHGPPSNAAIADSVSVTSWLPGRFDVMVVDANHALWDCGGSSSANPPAWAQCSSWTPPTNITFTNKPAIMHLGDGRLIVTARGLQDGQGWSKLWDWGKDTGPWVATGGALAGAGLGLSSW
jgi:hypothetical protein